MVYSVLWDDYEGFLMGAPEFEVHTFVQDPYGTFVDRQCSGEKRTGALYYNQDQEVWWGRVLVVLQEGIQGDSVQFHLWEDDTDPCKETSGRPPKTDDPTRNQIAGYAARFVSIVFGSNWIVSLAQGAALAIDLQTALEKDDFVGFIGAEGPAPGCWEASGPSSFEIRNAQGNQAGYAALDWTFGVRDPICPNPEPLPHGSVRISGPTNVQPNTSCYFSSSVTAGTPPYSYEWFNGTTVIGSGPDVVAYTGYVPFYLSLQVYDANGRPGSEMLLINVADDARVCVQ